MSNSSRPHGLQPTRLLRPWDFPARVLEWGNPCPGYSPLTDTQQSFICLITLPQPLREPREKKGVITFVKSPKPSAFMQCVCFQSTFISAVLGAVTKRLPCHTSHQKEGTAALVLAVSLVLFTNKRVCVEWWISLQSKGL